MASFEEQNRLAEKFGLTREWEEYKEKMGSHLGASDVYFFLADRNVILPLEDMKDYYLPDNFLEEIKVIDQTPYGIFFEYRGHYHIFQIVYGTIDTISHSFFCGLKRHGDIEKNLARHPGWDEETGRKKWAVWQEWEKFSQEKGLDHWWLDTFLVKKGYIKERERMAPVIDDDLTLPGRGRIDDPSEY